MAVSNDDTFDRRRRIVASETNSQTNETKQNKTEFQTTPVLHQARAALFS